MNSFFTPAFILDSFISERFRKRIQDIISVLIFIPFATPLIQKQFGFLLNLELKNILGISVFFFCLWFLFELFDWHYNSVYFLKEGCFERGKSNCSSLNFEVASILYSAKKNGLLRAFLKSVPGELMTTRLGISQKQISEFISKDNVSLDIKGEFGSLKDIFTFLLKENSQFADFLFDQAVTENEVEGVARFVERDIELERQGRRFWGRESLGKIDEVGKDWSYGSAYVLGKYGKDLSLSSGSGDYRYVQKEIDRLEVALSKSKEANAVLVGEEGVGKEEVIGFLAKRIRDDLTLPALREKRVVSLDTDALIATKQTKGEFESEIIKIFNDVVKAGNIILVIEDISSFVESSRVIGSDVSSLIDPYLASSAIQVVATSSSREFFSTASKEEGLARRFEKILIEEPDDFGVVEVLQNEVRILEKKNRIFFTYQAILEIASGARRYITEGVMPDKAVDLLVEITPYSVQKGKKAVFKKNVLEFIQQKTNISVGEIGEEEKQKLLNLEDRIHERVIGQDMAINAIAGAMRRARAGVGSSNRPIGSFLFIGPTGVGKTETAKSLAHVFFGSEDDMSRIDMSEFQDDSGLNRLIGSQGQMGVLSKTLRERPYGVLLLDELEKTNYKVLDLLLQVLDEGFFHDGSGKKVNARNNIFIATSNAASQLIREFLMKGEDLASLKDKIIDEIINQGIFKPEFLNRFDDVVLFHPLSNEDYKQIAVLMLNSLKKRLRQTKSLDLVVNQFLINLVVKGGSDPQFGARPMKRFIQDAVEQKIADKIIRGEVKSGDVVELREEDLV
jgi:ATP-dependent Clp protease ATP-binding subunit ClpC